METIKFRVTGLWYEFLNVYLEAKETEKGIKAKFMLIKKLFPHGNQVKSFKMTKGDCGLIIDYLGDIRYFDTMHPSTRRGFENMYNKIKDFMDV